MDSRRQVGREALLAAIAAASVASLLAWLGPPGTDFAAHAYQRTLFLQHGFSLWNNFWYAGRYSFVTYSVVYYPLAALLGIRLLAVATVGVGALAFTVVIGREWGPASRWSSRTFALVWGGIVLSAAFPFALGMALALLALWALQAARRWRFGALTLLTLAASPLAFLLLTVVLTGVALSRRAPLRRETVPALIVAGTAAVELVLWRLFPDAGRFPFSAAEAAAAVAFCLAGLLFTWRVESARVLQSVFAVYLVAVLGSYLVPSALGENVARLRYAAIPLLVLVFSLRRWRPLVPALAVLALAVAWNLSPLIASWVQTGNDPTAAPTAWTTPIRYLHQHLQPGFRVEAVDTPAHWPAAYLADAGIPLARGWYRQDDFPINAVLYRHPGPVAYQRWLRSLGVAYVVVSAGTTDYSAKAEARLVRSGRAGLRPVFRSGEVTVYSVPEPTPIVTGPESPALLSLTETRLRLRLNAPGSYRVAVRYSPYWKATPGCLAPRSDGMLELTAPRAGTVRLTFDVDAGRVLAALVGETPDCRPG